MKAEKNQGKVTETHLPLERKKNSGGWEVFEH